MFYFACIQWVITGFELGSSVHKCFQAGQIRLLDIVTKVGSTVSENDTKEDMELYLKDHACIKLELNRAIGVPSMDKILSEGNDCVLACKNIPEVW